MPVFERARPPTTNRDAVPVQDVEFARLYDAYFDPIYWYCRGRLGDASAAEDAASTVFARALAAGPRYDDPALRSWLFRIAHNVVVNSFRAARPSAPLESAFDLPDSCPLPDAIVVADEDRDHLLGALGRLPDEQRQVVSLRMAGLSGPEIAQVLGRSHGAVKMLQLRAFSRLRRLLTEAAGDPGGVRHG